MTNLKQRIEAALLHPVPDPDNNSGVLLTSIVCRSLLVEANDEIAHLQKLLFQMRTLVQDHPDFQKNEHDSLGIAVNNALKTYSPQEFEK